MNNNNNKRRNEYSLVIDPLVLYLASQEEVQVKKKDLSFAL